MGGPPSNGPGHKQGERRGEFRLFGTGGFWTISEHEVEAIRARVLAEFPDAGVSRRPTAFLSGPVIQNLSTGEMLGSPNRRDEGPDAGSPPGSGDAEEAAGGSS